MRDRGVALLLKKDKIALIKRVRNGQSYYVFPGGGIESGETPEQATKREAREELGVVVKVQRKVAEIVDEGTQHYFLVSIISGEFGSGKGNEMVCPQRDRGTYEPMWVCYDELEQLNIKPEQAVKMVMRVMREGDE
ncbi:Nudix hydrolase family protein [Bacillus sp. JCM 19046]|uniref:8-oxo-dGTP pyrophosphatase MutT (NUDIX family) n=1 Tax=Shouchella xiaoxiensis TaxID=766895 RepID=A0ABS2SPZ6_9BACI|nr:8-oxo-dGTP pyrophosphatase MutT (NUDIX family) [Shouchella xiaoxiensis]GAF11509.1 Nudix hydrolase family protein [Bacillus sp. JCM 19045]GAF16973.1 Nudix hydrolase family protein [Bacillus sp. JCM 19046]